MSGQDALVPTVPCAQFAGDRRLHQVGRVLIEDGQVVTRTVCGRPLADAHLSRSVPRCADCAAIGAAR